MTSTVVLIAVNAYVCMHVFLKIIIYKVAQLAIVLDLFSLRLYTSGPLATTCTYIIL